MMSGFGQLMVVLGLILILVIFGSSRIKSAGSDLGKAFKGFKKEIKEDDPDRDS